MHPPWLVGLFAIVLGLVSAQAEPPQPTPESLQQWERLEQLKPGEKISITAGRGEPVIARFQSWTLQELVYERKGKSTQVRKEDVRRVAVFRKGSRGQGAALGAAIGFGVGFAGGAAARPGELSRAGAGLGFGMVTAVGGAVIGLLVSGSKEVVVYRAP